MKSVAAATAMAHDVTTVTVKHGETNNNGYSLAETCLLVCVNGIVGVFYVELSKCTYLDINRY